MKKDLANLFGARPTLCQSVTATTTGTSVDTQGAAGAAIVIATDGTLDCTGGKTWTWKLQDSADGSTFADVDDSKMSGSLTSTAVKAFTTLTMTDVGVDADDFTIGTRVYELDTAAVPTITAGHVRVDCSASVAKADVCTAIIYAINNDVDAVATAAQGAGFTVVITAKTEDATTGNAIVTTENLTNGTVTAGTMAGGVDAVAEGLSGTGTMVLDFVIPAKGLRGVINYFGGKRYLRCVMTKAGAAPNIVMSAVVLYTPQSLPATA